MITQNPRHPSHANCLPPELLQEIQQRIPNLRWLGLGGSNRLHLLQHGCLNPERDVDLFAITDGHDRRSLYFNAYGFAVDLSKWGQGHFENLVDSYHWYGLDWLFAVGQWHHALPVWINSNSRFDPKQYLSKHVPADARLYLLSYALGRIINYNRRLAQQPQMAVSYDVEWLILLLLLENIIPEKFDSPLDYWQRHLSQPAFALLVDQHKRADDARLKNLILAAGDWIVPFIRDADKCQLILRFSPNWVGLNYLVDCFSLPMPQLEIGNAI